MRLKNLIYLCIATFLIVMIIITINGSIKNQKVNMDMVYIRTGTFIMGCTPKNHLDCDFDEKPAHKVKIKAFYIGKYEVTQDQFKQVMGYNPSYHKGTNRPVEHMSWFEALEFCNNLSIRNGFKPVYTIHDKNVSWDKSADGYRVPAEAEWEYAARGGWKSKGYQYAGSNEPDAVAWYFNVSDSSKLTGTHVVGTKAPNELGIYDMSGNVDEWCWDWYQHNYYSISVFKNPSGPSKGEYRVYRGGAWGTPRRDLRVSDRGSGRDWPTTKSDVLGFRVAKNAQ